MLLSKNVKDNNKSNKHKDKDKEKDKALNNSKDQNNSYTGKDITILEHCEAIRRYPGMYIGCIKNPNHIVMEVIDNAVDECIMERCNLIKVEFHDHNKVTITDNGRGIPIDKYNDKYLACELVMITIHAGGKFNDKIYSNSGGLHGVGLSAVSALSEHLTVVIKRDRKCCTMILEKGVLKNTSVVETDSDKTGTSMTIVPDPTIFESTSFIRSDLHDRLKFLTYLNPNLTIEYIDHVENYSKVMYSTKGISGIVEENTKNPAMKNNIVVKYDDSEIKITAIINWEIDCKDDKFFAFTNCIMQPDGGIHVQSIKSGIIEFLNGLKEITDIDEDGVMWNDIKAGLRCGIDLRMQNPKYNAQSKLKLISGAIRKRIEAATKLTLNNLHSTNTNVLDHLISIAQASLIKRNTKDNTGSKLSAFLHEGRLVDCRSKDPSQNEIFLVEGESAGGPVKQCRNKLNQAVLTLRGKIMNVEKAALRQIMKSDALNVIATAIGGKHNTDGTIDLSGIKYHKILILVDSDVDGDHIVSLILTYFYRYMKEVIEKNYLYIVQPPLYVVNIKGSKMYFKRHNEIISFMTDIAVDKHLEDKKATLHEKDLISTIFHIAYNTSELNNRFVAKIIDAVISEGITEYNTILESFDTIIKYILENESSTDCYINNKQQVLIEDYRTGDKLVLTQDLFIEKIMKLVQTLSKYSEAINNLKSKLRVTNLITLLNEIYEKLKVSMVIQRFKGLGEMNASQLYETSMCPERRIIKRVTLNDPIKADKICNVLMGHKVTERRRLIHDSSMLAE